MRTGVAEFESLLAFLGPPLPEARAPTSRSAVAKFPRTSFPLNQPIRARFPQCEDRMTIASEMRIISRRRLTVPSWSAVYVDGFAARTAVWQSSPAAKNRLILLGTGGGPRPRRNSFPSSQVVLVNNAAYVVDCGNGVAIQLARAGVPLTCPSEYFHHTSAFGPQRRLWQSSPFGMGGRPANSR